MLVGAVLRYLAVAHFGRGRGNFVEGEAPSFWQSEVEKAVAAQGGDLPRLWQAVRSAPGKDEAAGLLVPVVARVTDNVLACLYPRAALLAGAPPASTGSDTGQTVR
jgi:hypothetical protein